MPKFYKTIVTVEVLSEDEWPTSNWSLQSLANQHDHGSFSLSVTFDKPKRLSRASMAEECAKHRTDPEYFGIDENGKLL